MGNEITYKLSPKNQIVLIENLRKLFNDYDNDLIDNSILMSTIYYYDKNYKLKSSTISKKLGKYMYERLMTIISKEGKQLYANEIYKGKFIDIHKYLKQ